MNQTAANDLFDAYWRPTSESTTITWLAFVLLTWEFFIHFWLSKCHLCRYHTMSFDIWHFIPTDSFESSQEHPEYVFGVHRSHLWTKMVLQNLDVCPNWPEPGVVDLYNNIFLSCYNQVLMFDWDNRHDQSIEEIKLSSAVKWECC